MIKEVTKNEMTDLNTGVKLVNFHATWCGPCKMLKPVLSMVANEYAGKVVVYHVDVDKDRDYAIEMKVSGTPTTYIYKDGKVVDTVVGYLPKDAWLTRLSKLV